MKVLIIGKGFLGTCLKNYLLKREPEWVIESRGRHFPTEPYDIVFNTAGNIKSKLIDELLYDNSVAPLNYLVDYSNLNRKVKFIHLGSSSEYGDARSPYTESRICRPNTDYALSKFMGSNQIFLYGMYKHLWFSSIRPFSIYGENDHKEKFIPTIIDSILNKKEIHLYPGTHDWLYEQDFCELCYKVSLLPFLPLTINACSGQKYTNREIVQTLFDISNTSEVDCPIIEHVEPMYSYDKDNWVGDNSLAKNRLHWEPKFTLKEGLLDLYNKTKTKNSCS